MSDRGTAAEGQMAEVYTVTASFVFPFVLAVLPSINLHYSFDTISERSVGHGSLPCNYIRGQQLLLMWLFYSLNYLMRCVCVYTSY